MIWRRPAVLLALCAQLAGGGHAVAFESRGARSCSGWQEFRNDERAGYPRNAEVYETWLVGYLSGIVAGSGMDFLSGTDNETLFRMVDGFCRTNPRLNLAAAGIFTARALMQEKGILNRPTLP